MHYEILGQLRKMIGQLDGWLETADAHAKAKPFDPNVYLGLRLAPDQFPLSRQVQSTCDSVKLGAARLSGKEAPNHPDTEQTLDELRARVRAVATYLDSFSSKDFQGVESRVISQPRWEGKVMSATDYLLEHVVPNFFFHLNHTYAILRHNGVDLGKRDYLGTLTLRSP
jgi:hypothetical protein